MFRKTVPNKRVGKKGDHNTTGYTQSLAFTQRIQFCSPEKNYSLKTYKVSLSHLNHVSFGGMGIGRDVEGTEKLRIVTIIIYIHNALIICDLPGSLPYTFLAT